MWSVHPEFLDRAALVACWRETLLAQKVLEGKTSGYRNHPQLLRFRETANPVDTIGAFLLAIHDEATARGYDFNATKITSTHARSVLDQDKLRVTDAQLAYERAWLRSKLEARAPQDLTRGRWLSPDTAPHPLFDVVCGDIEPWEKVQSGIDVGPTTESENET